MKTLDNKPTLINDHFANYKQYNIPKAQLILTDIPYNIGENAYASNPMWYKDGDNKNGESDLAKKNFFNSDVNFKISEFLHYASKLLKPEPKQKGDAGCVVVFCEFMQQFEIIQKAKDFGFNGWINLVFRKNYSPQVLKANMKIVGNSEYAILLYRDKLPKFNNEGKMIFNHWNEFQNSIDWIKDSDTPKIHPTQKPVDLLKKIIEVFTSKGDVVIDMCAGSGTTLKAAAELERLTYGFEIDKKFFKLANEQVISKIQKQLF